MIKIWLISSSYIFRAKRSLQHAQAIVQKYAKNKSLVKELQKMRCEDKERE